MEITAGEERNDSRKYFVSREDFEKILNQTDDKDFRVVLVLSRYGALRCPSEIVNLKWADIT